MDIRELVPGYSVSPQIDPSDFAQLKAEGYSTVICNRPDGENPPEYSAAEMRAKAEAEGLTFIENPLSHGSLTMEIIDTQRQAIDSAKGPVLAYCAPGNRSSVLWALAMAGRMPADEMIEAAAKYGYRLDGIRGQIEALAQG